MLAVCAIAAAGRPFTARPGRRFIPRNIWTVPPSKAAEARLRQLTNPTPCVTVPRMNATMRLLLVEPSAPVDAHGRSVQGSDLLRCRIFTRCWVAQLAS